MYVSIQELFNSFRHVFSFFCQKKYSCLHRLGYLHHIMLYGKKNRERELFLLLYQQQLAFQVLKDIATNYGEECSQLCDQIMCSYVS